LICDNTLYANREEYDTVLVQLIQKHSPDLVVLAGFMRILTPIFTNSVRSINLHPSLLPAFKGSKAIERSFQSDETVCGVTVHWVNDELDGGDIILQKSFTKDLNDTLEEFSAKIRQLEYEILPQSIIHLLT
jgi:phosphoribosylglycinamide formyltransferase-1